ncbi:YciI family protein [Kosakonia sp.]|uniref:YciI family protein n=1 Tax=Kosakonia sp. TaxID=1916651 RepID=UPI0028A00087|nr:YciI family protein [Kosakonia sp.]
MMLHAVILHYQCRKEELTVHLEGHKTWLINGMSSGKVIFAGPLSDNRGGFILLDGENEEHVVQYMQTDPFVDYHLVSVTIYSIEPAMIAQGFAEKWAPTAKVIAASGPGGS